MMKMIGRRGLIAWSPVESICTGCDEIEQPSSFWGVFRHTVIIRHHQSCEKEQSLIYSEGRIRIKFKRYNLKRVGKPPVFMTWLQIGG